MLKYKNRYPNNEPESDEETSVAGSQHSHNNIITFKPKNHQKNTFIEKNNQYKNNISGIRHQKNEEYASNNAYQHESGVIRNNNHQNSQKQNRQSLQQHIHEVLNSKPHKTSTLNAQTHPDPSVSQHFNISASN